MERVREISAQIGRSDASSLSRSGARRLRLAIAEASDELRERAEELDPTRLPGVVFQPSNPATAGRVAGIAMVAQPRNPLASADMDRFYGSGVYALYYNGAFDAYEPISGSESPIYVGKADPADPASKTAARQGERLSSRLRDHKRTITKAVDTLRVEDFEYRALVVETGYQTAAEDYLIHLFKPIWNNEMAICYGFGKHGDDPETRANQRSPWDTLHPGREWAYRSSRMRDAHSAEQIRG